MAAIREVHELQGLSIRDAERLAHPTLLSKWSNAGLYWIDVDAGVFRLTEAGRKIAYPSLYSPPTETEQS